MSRDYKGEYRRRQEIAKSKGFKNYYNRRITEGVKRGYTKSQARGSPRPTELPVSIKNVNTSKRNWISAAIKEMHSDIRFNDNENAREQYNKTVKDYQTWRRGGFKDDDRHVIIEDIREYMETYNDEYDFDVGESPK